MTIRVGFFGAGFISGVHRWFLRESGVEHRIVAVCDPDAAKAQRFAGKTGAQVVGEDELLSTVDAVYVTTWTAEHPRLVAKVAAAGLPVFCEKPLAVDADLAAGMVGAVEGAGVLNQVGLVLRSVPPARLVRHLLADERAGRPLAVVFRDDQYLPIQGQYGSTWRADPTKAGHGTMLEHSIHDVDVLRWWLGPVESLSATTREVHGHAGIEDVAAVRFDFANGAAGTLVSVWHDILERPSARHIELFCERLHVKVEGDIVGPVRWRYTGEDEQVLEGSDLVDWLRRRGDVEDNPARVFLTAIRDGLPSAPPDFAAALPAHRVVDAIYRSAAAGGAVVTDPEGR